VDIRCKSTESALTTKANGCVTSKDIVYLIISIFIDLFIKTYYLELLGLDF
jgi:hypothetical protein